MIGLVDSLTTLVTDPFLFSFNVHLSSYWLEYHASFVFQNWIDFFAPILQAEDHYKLLQYIKFRIEVLGMIKLCGTTNDLMDESDISHWCNSRNSKF